MTTIDIVIPVHGGMTATRRCLESVWAAENAAASEIVVVNDASPDPDLARYLREQSESGRITLIEQSSRQGYAAAINRVAALHAGRDLVILQSDAFVAQGWLDRLKAHASGARIGVVGTFTNAAGSATYPRPHQANALPAGESEALLDQLFAQTNAGSSVALPYVTGPCLYLCRACIALVGQIDGSALGSDYGAEIDFCMRAGVAGFRHLIACDVFIGHEAHASYGAAEAFALRERSARALAKLFPGYVLHESEMRARDPLRPFARRVDLARLARSPRRRLVFVSHPWGGGIRRYMDDLAALVDEQCEVLYLEPAAGDAVKLGWQRAGEDFVAYFRLPDDLAMLAETLRGIGVERLHFQHVHMHPRAILDLPAAARVPYDCTLHDYYAICPQYHLVTAQGRYCGEPDIDGCTACLAGRPAQWGQDIVGWRALFATFLRGADRVIAPSEDIAARVRRYVPALPIHVWPHPEMPARSLPRVTRVAVLGNLSPEKGLHVIAACASDARARNLPLVFRVIGSTTESIAQSPDVPLTIYGGYQDVDLPGLIAAEKPDVILFAAQVPETYAYTLSAALATGLPIVASALGALPERLAGHPHRAIVPWDANAAIWNAALLAADGRSQAQLAGTRGSGGAD